MDYSDLELRATRYAEEDGLLEIQTKLGFGTDGAVWKTIWKTAVKVFERRENFETELRCYQRLGEYEVSEIKGFAVPRLINHDDKLWVIEMSIVAPPYLLDFGKAHLDQPPHFPESTMEYYRREQEEMWEERLPEVQSILWSLESMGIYYFDAKPGNIRFADDPAGDS